MRGHALLGLDVALARRTGCGPVEHAGGDLSIYVEDPEGDVVEIWDYFEDGDAWPRVARGRARAGALASPGRHADLPAASALALSGEQ
jgi:hypothetical protein